MFFICIICTQARNQGDLLPLENFSPPLEECVQRFWAPLRKLSTPPGAPSWLRACIALLTRMHGTHNTPCYD